MAKTYFASDLHLFANRSEGKHYLEAIARKAARADNFVLGGDIFDFRWARTATIDEAAQEAVRWLAELAARCPDCHFHFLLGNHDNHRKFTRRLAELEKTVPNLSWHRFYVRLGSSIFLHGDVADRRMDADMLAGVRARWTDRKKRGRLASSLYDVVVLAKLHKPLPYLVYAKKLTARRIRAYLEGIGHGPRDGVRNVYFGHTHRAMENYYYRELTFHNGGASIKGMDFRILEAA